MNGKTHTLAIVAERDPDVAAAAARALEERSFRVTAATTLEGLLDRLRTSTVPLALVGGLEGCDSPFTALRELVMISPLTSVILLSGAAAEEVEERAEGYGILGHVGRDVPPEALRELLDRFDKIREVLS